MILTIIGITLMATSLYCCCVIAKRADDMAEKFNNKQERQYNDETRR